MNHHLPAALFALFAAFLASDLGVEPTVEREKAEAKALAPCEEEARFLLEALETNHPGQKGAMLTLLSMKVVELEKSEHATCRAVADVVRKHN